MTPIQYFYKIGSEVAMEELISMYPPHLRPAVRDSLSYLTREKPHYFQDYAKWISKNFLKTRGDLATRIVKGTTKQVAKPTLGEAADETGLLLRPIGF